MTSNQTDKYVFSEKDLAIIGMLDEVYDIYESLKDGCLHTIGDTSFFYTFIKRLNSEKYDDKKTCVWLNKICLYLIIPRICNPLFNKYKWLFSENPDELHVTRLASEQFQMIKRIYPVGEFTVNKNTCIYTPFAFNCDVIDFCEFIPSFMEMLISSVYPVIRDHYSELSSEEVYSYIYHHVDQTIKTKTKGLEHNNIIFQGHEPTTDILYVFDRLSNVGCSRSNHPITTKLFFAKKVNGDGIGVLPVHYCTVCHHYFIGYRTLALYEKMQGKFLFYRKQLVSIMKTDFSGFSPESRLHSMGYNVIDGKMSLEERRSLLVHLLKHKKIAYIEMCATIENDIERYKNIPRMSAAVDKWKSDLKYIGDYEILKNKTADQ